MSISSAKLNYKLTLIRDLPYDESLVNELKIRLVGRIIGIEDSNNTILILDERRGLIIDISSVITAKTYMPKLKDLIMISGDLCNNINELPIPLLAVAHAEIDIIDSNQILQATMIKLVEELDLEGWREGVKIQNGLETC